MKISKSLSGKRRRKSGNGRNSHSSSCNIHKVEVVVK